MLSQKDQLRTDTIYPKVLVVGMSRTGTLSMKRALEILYGGKAYHMSEVINKPKHLEFWAGLVSGVIKPDSVNWHKFFEGYVAITDMPSAYYFEAITQAFPQIKVILTYRDEKDWLGSYTRLMRAALLFSPIRFLPPLNRLWPFSEQLHRLLFGETAIGQDGINPIEILEGYRKHNERVRSAFQDKELLEFNAKEGWLPLCNFIEVEVPLTSFPHRNSGGAGPAKIIGSAVGRLSLLPTFFIGLLVIVSVGIVLLLFQI